MPNSYHGSPETPRRQPARTPSQSSGDGAAQRRTHTVRRTQQPPRQGSGQQQPDSGGAKKKKGSKRAQKYRGQVKYNWFRAILMVGATVAGCIFLALFGLRSASDLFGLEQEDQYFTVAIPAGATISEISDILTDLGIVEQPLTFRLYTGFKYSDLEIKGGDYNLNSNMGYDQIMDKLIKGEGGDSEVKLTFREGLTLREIANTLEEYEVCSADAFLEYLDSNEFGYDFYDLIPMDDLRYHTLEGYLFPDTYDFYVNERVASVAKKFLDNFDLKITSDMQRRMMDLNLTLDQTITLASIIQSEAGDPSHMRRVSSVFHNRLNNSASFPRLQSDVTLLYVESDIKPYLQSQNQPMYDAYNTYVREGIPVAPICNPGIEAIRAALYPAETQYYYFVTDVNGEFYYSVTSEEHYQNIRTAQREDESGAGSVHGINTR